MTRITVKWDRSIVHRMLTVRLDQYHAALKALMQEETRLSELGGDEPWEEVERLNASVAVIEKHGGDATSLLAHRANLVARFQEHQPDLAAVRERLSAVRECLKWADYAHSGIHWLCLSESQYGPLNLIQTGEE